MTDTKQMAQQRDEKGRITGGVPPAGFNKHPENRHNGAWKKEDTPRFKLEQMMKLAPYELQEVVDDLSAPMFEQKLAKAILEGQWREIREMIEQVYGKASQSVDLTSKGEALTMPTVIIEGVYATKPNFRPDNHVTEIDDVAETSRDKSS